MKKLILFLFISIYSQNLFPQTKEGINFYSGLFYLSRYTVSDEFKNIKNDLEKVDSLFSKSKTFFNDDISEALLCLTFTCLPFDKIELKIFSRIINIPLPSPPKKIFESRLKNLPSKLFFDSPHNDFGDKDKLSHFFGNAFLRYNFSPFNISKFMGIFVELTEENFFANGGYNYRDLIANNIGEIFAEMLLKNKNSKPSKAFLIYQLLFFRDRI
ncbi:MAG: hypothetical protein AB1695_06305 [Stygiobacter sp.]